MFNLPKKHPHKAPVKHSNRVLHDWDREDELESVTQFSDCCDLHSLSELFETQPSDSRIQRTQGGRGAKKPTPILSACAAINPRRATRR